MAMVPYVVRQGDYLAKLAHTMGFDPDAVWNDDANAQLRDLRPDPNVLAPGDVLHVPERPTRTPLRLAVGSANAFKAKIPKVKVSLAFKDGGKVLAHEPYVLEGLSKRLEGVADADGAISFEAPLHVREVRVTFPKRRLAFPIRVGELDPIDTPSGLRQRLVHLGFYGWAVGAAASGAFPPLGDDFDVAAITEFQKSQGLEPTGVADAATRDALSKAHGS